MASVYPDLLSNADIEYLNGLPEVLAAKASLDGRSSGMVYFSVSVTESIRATLSVRIGFDLVEGSSIPMRQIKGDTAPHSDVGPSNFQRTYLLYLTDSPGELIVGSQSYPIQTNTGFVFDEGLFHETRSTENVPRLLLGPMNERAEPVGSPVAYFPTQMDADDGTNPLGQSGSYTVGDGGPQGGYTHWRLAARSSGSSSKSVVYANGSVLNGDGSYYLYPGVSCFLEGSTVLCQVKGKEKEVPVEDLEVGTLVKTRLDGYKPVVLIGKGVIQNPGNNVRMEDRLYKCSPSEYPELTRDLQVTGHHSILVFPFTDKQKADITQLLGKLFVTDHLYRLPACIDDRAEPWNSEGTQTIQHFALDHHDDGMNYGVQANGGLLVETCAIRTLKNKTNLTLTE